MTDDALTALAYWPRAEPVRSSMPVLKRFDPASRQGGRAYVVGPVDRLRRGF